jgi:hypothetical protein
VDEELTQLRRELERVRAENVRLSRLLDLRGLDTAPLPEQLAAARPVTMSSSVSDKLALYAGLFRARTDVYAVRWENVRTGASGWMPAVAGGWRKGMDRRAANHLPLTPEVVAAHLSGDRFIGLYPLLTNNTCHFLVADFDGPAAMLDALAYGKAARAGGVPVAVEIRSHGAAGVDGPALVRSPLSPSRRAPGWRLRQPHRGAVAGTAAQERPDRVS